MRVYLQSVDDVAGDGAPQAAIYNDRSILLTLRR